MTDKRFQSRKFILACAAFLAGLALFIVGRLTSGEWLEFTQWILALYIAGNVFDQAVTRTTP